MSSKDLWRDCTEKCMSQRHGDCFSAALTRREPTDRELASSMSLLCANVGSLVDTCGRTILHMAASLGRRELVQWLVQRCGADLNAQDRESGYTPLHRSIFYGQLNVAVTLVQMGADPSILDYNFLSPIELAMKDRVGNVRFTTDLPCELYVWGTNTNFNLGTGNMHGRLQPEILDYFRKLNPPVSIVQVYMEKFHTIMVSACGRVWTCGHGQGGRLGLGSEGTVLVPRQIQLGYTSKSSVRNTKWHPGQPEVCVAAAVGRDHTILLMQSTAVLVFGLNTHHVLGLYPPPDRLLEPQRLPVKNTGDIRFAPRGVCAGRFHSVIWSYSEIWTFGLNAGQLGHTKSEEKTIILPKAVNALFYKDAVITQVAASDGATVLVTNHRNLWVFHEYQKTKISMRYSFMIEQVRVVGGHLDSELDPSILAEKGEPLKVAALSKDGSVFLWQEKDLQMTRCILSLNRQLRVSDIQLKVSRTSMLMVTNDGEAYLGVIKPSKKKATEVKPSKARRAPFSPPGNNGEYHVHYKQAEGGSFKEFLDPDLCYSVILERLPYAHRAVRIASDPKGKNFALIQAHPSAFLNDVPELPPDKQRLGQDLSNLLSEASEWDTLHDVVFEVEHRRFAAHQYIVTRHSNILLRMVQEAKESIDKGTIPVIKLSDISPDIFEQLLQFMYAGECSLIHPIPSKLTSQPVVKSSLIQKFEELDNDKIISEEENPLVRARAAARKLGLSKFLVLSNNVKYEGGRVLWAKVRKNHVYKLETIQVDWRDSSEFCDARVVSRDGMCFNVHKCMLASRSEYFHSMLAGGWVESQGKKDLQLPLDQHVLAILFDYIYKDATPVLDNIAPADFELGMRALIAADLLLISPFKVRCEAAIASLLTFRNVKVALEMAYTYNADALRDCCYQFVCFNLPSVLEAGILSGLPSPVLEGLPSYFRKMHPRMASRIITPFSCAPSAEYLRELASTTNIAWDDIVDIQMLDDLDSDKKIKVPSKKRSRPRRISETQQMHHRTDSMSSANSDDMDTSVDVEALDLGDLVEKQDSEINQPFEKMSLENESMKEKAGKIQQWVKVINNSKAQKSVQARLKAAAMAREEPLASSFTCLSPSKQDPQIITSASFSPSLSLSSSSALVQTNHSTPIQSIVPEVLEKHFPQLGGDTVRGTAKVNVTACTTPNGKRLTKLSQKQRKKLATEEVVPAPSQPSVGIRGWGHREDDVAGSPLSLSLADIMQEQLQKSKFHTPTASKPINIKRSPTLGITSPHTPSSLSSPWGRVDIDMSPKTPPATPTMSFESSPSNLGPAVKFSDIMADEIKQRENWTRMRAKPLSLTQIEDKAIDDLINFYNANEACEERITVHRVLSTQVARPVWVTSKYKDTL